MRNTALSKAAMQDEWDIDKISNARGRSVTAQQRIDDITLSRGRSTTAEVEPPPPLPPKPSNATKPPSTKTETKKPDDPSNMVSEVVDEEFFNLDLPSRGRSTHIETGIDSRRRSQGIDASITHEPSFSYKFNEPSRSDTMVDHTKDEKKGDITSSPINIHSSEPTNLAFFPLLYDIPTISNQVENGINSTKRLSRLIERFGNIEDEYAKGLFKLLAHERNKLGHDDMLTFGTARRTLFSQLKSLAELYGSVGEKLVKQISQPMMVQNNDFDEQCRILYKIYHELSKEQGEMKAETFKQNQNCNKLLNKVRSALQDHIEEKTEKENKTSHTSTSSNLFSKFKSNITSALSGQTKEEYLIESRTKALQACSSYNKYINECNEKQEQFYQHQLPQIIKQFEDIETNRMVLSISSIRELSNSLIQLGPRIEKIGQNLLDTCDKVNINDDMQKFARDSADLRNPQPPLPYSYDLPVQPKDIMTCGFDVIKPPKSTFPFKVTLEAIMEKDKETEPSLTVPRIVTTLIDSVKNVGDGLHTQGIFRISPNMTNVKQLRESIIDGNYNIQSLCPDPHTPASLLKTFLRELSDPLVPSSLYNDAIDLSKNNATGPEYQNFLKQLPKVNLNVILYLHAFLKEVSSLSSENKMTMSNLCIVFSPGFIRCPEDNPALLLANIKYEYKFLEDLLQNL